MWRDIKGSDFMDQTKLQSRLADLTIAAMTDANAAAALSVPIFVNVMVVDLAKLVDTRGLRAKIERAKSNANPLIVDAAVSALGVIDAKYDWVELSIPAILIQFQNALGGLLAAGTGILQADVDAIVALGQRYLCDGPVATADVTTARAAMVFQAAVDARKVALDAYAAKIKAADQFATTIYQNFSNPNTTMPVWPADFKTFVDTIH